MHKKIGEEGGGKLSRFCFGERKSQATAAIKTIVSNSVYYPHTCMLAREGFASDERLGKEQSHE